MPTKPVTFESETDIRYEMLLETSEDTRKPRFWCILILSFSGRYRPGHNGAPDAAYIQGITQAAMGVWAARGLVLDLRKLDYVWGDEMEEVLGCRGELEEPYAVVVGDQCHPAITTLVRQFHPKIEFATDLDHIFDNMDEALKYVRQLA